MLSTKLNVAVVGLGAMGGLHAAISNTVENVRFVAAVESDRRILRLAKKLLPEVRFYSDVAELCKDGDFDAVYVCTPVHAHLGVVKELLRLGSFRGLFVEKPLGRDADECREMTELADKVGLAAQVGYQKRFNPVFRKVREIVKSGQLGRIVIVRAHHFTAGVLESGVGWRYEPPFGGVVLDWGPHLVDLLGWFFGPLHLVTASGTNLYSTRVEDYAQASLKMDGGGLAVIEFGWSMRNYRRPELVIEIHGTGGVLRATEDGFTIVTSGVSPHLDEGQSAFDSHEISEKVPYLLGPPETVLQDLSFLYCVRSGSRPTSSFRDTIPLQATLDEIRKRIELPRISSR